MAIIPGKTMMLPKNETEKFQFVFMAVRNFALLSREVLKRLSTLFQPDINFCHLP